MKNTLTISITKTYEFKTDAETMDVAFDQFINTTPRKLIYLDATVEPTDFKIWTPKKTKQKGKK